MTTAIPTSGGANQTVNNLNKNPFFTALYPGLQSGAYQIKSVQVPVLGQFGQPLTTGGYNNMTGQNTSAPVMQSQLAIVDSSGKPVPGLAGINVSAVPGSPGAYQLQFSDPGSEGSISMAVGTGQNGVIAPVDINKQMFYTPGAPGGVLNGFVKALGPEIKAIAPVVLAGLGGAAAAGAFGGAGAAGASSLAGGAGASGSIIPASGLAAVPGVGAADIAAALPGTITAADAGVAGAAAAGAGAAGAGGGAGLAATPAAATGATGAADAGLAATPAAAGGAGGSSGLSAAEQAMVNSAPGDLASSGAYAPGGTGFGNVVQGTTGLTGSATGNAAGMSLSDIANAFSKANSAYNSVNQSMNPQQYGASGGSGMQAPPAQSTDIRNAASQHTVNTEPQYGTYNFVPQIQSNPNLLSGLEYGLATKGYKEGGDVDDSNPTFITGKTGFHVQGPGTGQSDSIPARLADGEYVIDADTVAALGDGSNKAGAAALDKMREAIRKHKRAAPINKIPPPAKHPLAYMKGR